MPQESDVKPSQFNTNVHPLSQSVVMYIMDDTQVSTFMSDLIDHVHSLPDLFTNPIDNVISLKYFPFQVSVLNEPPTASYITIGSWTSSVTQGIKVPEDSTNTIVAIESNLGISTQYGGSDIWFSDLNPYTSVQLFLPFKGLVDIDPMWAYRGFDLTLSYDLNTGMGRYYLIDNDDQFMLASYDCMISEEMLMAGGQGYNIARSLTNVGAGIASSLISTAVGATIGSAVPGIGTAVGAVAGAISSLPQTAVSVISAMQNKVSVAGSSNGGYLSWFDPMNPFFLIKRPKFSGTVKPAPDGFESEFGLPLLENRILGNLEGFVKVGEIHLMIQNATSRELDEITYLLKDGVIIEDTV